MSAARAEHVLVYGAAREHTARSPFAPVVLGLYGDEDRVRGWLSGYRDRASPAAVAAMLGRARERIRRARRARSVDVDLADCRPSRSPPPTPAAKLALAGALAGRPLAVSLRKTSVDADRAPAEIAASVFGAHPFVRDDLLCGRRRRRAFGRGRAVGGVDPREPRCGLRHVAGLSSDPDGSLADRPLAGGTGAGRAGRTFVDATDPFRVQGIATRRFGDPDPGRALGGECGQREGVCDV